MRIGKLGLHALLTIGCLITLGGPTSAANWPRFRGPNGTGIADDKDIPVEWTEQNILWKTTIPGIGHSSPVVWGNHVFLETATTDGKKRLLLCLGAKDGKILWTCSFPASPAHIHQYNTLASSTPAVDGERVYSVVWDGKDVSLYAHDLAGHQVWKQDLGEFHSQHGVAASPVVYDGKVYLANDQDGQSMLLAFDAKTGQSVWQAERRAYRACYSTPFILERPGGKTELVVVSTTAITGYNPQSGTPNWNWTWNFTSRMPLRTTASAVFGPEMIFASSGDGGGDRHMVAVRLHATATGTRPDLMWENKRDFPYVPSMLFWKDHIYSVNDAGVAACHVAETGKVVWSERLGGSFKASPILVDGKIYAASEQGDVFVFEASPTGKQLARNALGEAIRATPAVADSRLFVRGKNHLFCIGMKASP
jgi:outer membrane protein assembly factor BamB